MFVLDNRGCDLFGTKVETTADEDPENGEQPLGCRRFSEGMFGCGGGHGLFAPIVFSHVGPLGILFSEKNVEVVTDSNFYPEALCFHKLCEVSGPCNFLGDGGQFFNDPRGCVDLYC